MATIKRREPTPWWSWLEARMQERDVTAAELERLSGGEITSAQVSSWKKGPHGASPEKAIIAAELLQADVADALRAAGHNTVARVVDPDATPVRQVDPIITEIMDMTFLGLKVRKALVDQYLADKEEAQQRARKLAKAWSVEGDDSDNPAA